jgi:hypothetical protein
MKSRPSASMEPQSAWGGCAPSPRKESPAVSVIIQPTFIEIRTSNGATTFGSTWRVRMCALVPPEARAAST